MKHRYSHLLPGLTLISDIILLNVAYCLAHGTLSGEHPRMMLIKTLCWVLLSPLFKIYTTPRPLLLKENMFRFSEVLCCHLIIIFSLIYVTKYFDVLSYRLFATYLVFIVLVSLQRHYLSIFLDYIRKKGFNGRRILIIGDEEVAKRLKMHFDDRPAYGYDILPTIFEQNMAYGSHEVLAKKLLDQNAHEIFFCYKKIDATLVSFLISFGAQHKINIKLMSDVVLTDRSAKIINYDTLPLLHLRNCSGLGKTEILAKRGFDILFSSSLIIIASPLFAMLYLITKLTSKGPAYYTQERIGLNGRPFRIIKFRSMYINAEEMGPQLSKHGDPRITKWGLLIRKTRLDELPQFFNVLKGEMSVVGPRPERIHFIEKIAQIAPHYKLLQCLKPGITSIGQIRYGYAENVEQMCERLEYDLMYLQDISFRSDVGLILNTVRVMIQGKGK
ncbi:sugar transferase [Pedobacter chinensis]|uniref:Sugar transferase n=1 Tax=Pedobacter chinensis TaxID=2282421 RepID=A0A369PYK9_9SPHI|nr:sugar transferase [Pedobacter chinensis]RDC55826.1 sugar transferase [Pedobacter chinensis]